MRYYLFGDIHGNSYALERCIDHIHELNIDKIFCLGDVVGWLPFGDRTLESMRSYGFPTVAGNHDLLVAGLFKDHPNQLDRMQASAFNAGLLSKVEGAFEYLLNLPLAIVEKDFIVVHHSPFDLPPPGEKPTINCFNYLDREALLECLESWRNYDRQIIFSGHDHLPAVYELPETSGNARIEDVIVHRPPASGPLVIDMKPGVRYWVKAGSVGGPYRDGIPMANAVLYDSDAGKITLFRLPWNTDRLRRELSSQRFFANLDTIRRYLELL